MPRAARTAPALAAALALALGGCAATPPAATAAATAPLVADAPLDAIARDYVALVLEMGERDPGYVDAYYGPAEWQAAARAAPRDLPALGRDTAALIARLDAVGAAPPAGQPAADPLAARRAAFLRAQLVALATRVRMLSGDKLDFVTEAKGLFGVAPVLRPLRDYDPILARLDALVPGDGPLAARVNAFEDRFNIPADRLRAVLDAGIAECKRRTMAHLPLPEKERFTLALVTGKPWSGYNYYQGQAMSRIEINTDLPVRVERAVDLGCHEGYPGHHVYNALLERELVDKRGWAEFSVYPLYSPQSFIAEGSANYGIELAFPGDEQFAFATTSLFPIAGLKADGARARAYLDLLKAKKGLTGARYTIAADYLAGRLDRAAARTLLERYNLLSSERAEQSLKFIDTYRSYIINYGLGLDMVRAHVEAAGPGADARWARMEAILSGPTLPSDLKPQ